MSIASRAALTQEAAESPPSKQSGQNPAQCGRGWEVGIQQPPSFTLTQRATSGRLWLYDRPMDSLPVGAAPRQYYVLRQAPMVPGESVILARAGSLQRTQEKRVEATLCAAGGGGPATSGTPTPAAQTLALSNGHISPRDSSPCSVEVWEGAHLMRLRKPGISRPEAPRTRRSRGRVAGYSRRSRARLMERLAQVRTVEVALPMFTSRTFPDRVPGAAEIPGMDDRFWKRLQRRFPDAGIIWHRELKDRKSGETVGEFVPHFHELVWNVNRFFPFKEERGEWVRVERHGSEWRTFIAWLDDDGRKVWMLQSCAPDMDTVEGGRCENEDTFSAWWSRNWYEVVGSGDWWHFYHGGYVELLQSSHAVRCYLTKSAAYLSKEEDDACKASSYYMGARSWGVRSGENIPWGNPVAMPISQAVFYCLRRAGAAYISKVTQRARRFQPCRVFVNQPAEWLRLSSYYARSGIGPAPFSSERSGQPMLSRSSLPGPRSGPLR